MAAHLLLKTAASIGQPVSVLAGTRKPGDRWLPSDTLAAMAWQSYADSLCPGCGWPRELGMDEWHQNLWRADAPLRCYSCTAIERKASDKVYEKQPLRNSLYFNADLVAPKKPPNVGVTPKR